MNEGCNGSAQGPKLAGEKSETNQQLAVVREAADCSVRGRREGRLLVSAVEKRKEDAGVSVGRVAAGVAQLLLAGGSREKRERRRRGRRRGRRKRRLSHEHLGFHGFILIIIIIIFFLLLIYFLARPN